MASPHVVGRMNRAIQYFFFYLFESMCGLGFIYSRQFKLFTENRIIHILVGFNIILITEIFASKTQQMSHDKTPASEVGW